jgi:2-polyprenyl-6-methoxyphenol hydroxylase-like FAD-dependent oxidoreductase
VKIVYGTVSRLLPQHSLDQRATIEFEDGSLEEADLIVRADGIRSPIRLSLFGEHDERTQPQYLGVCAVGGVLEIPLAKEYIDDPSIVFAVGSTGVFGYCGLSRSNTDKLLYFSFYDSEHLPERGSKLDRKLITQPLKERHRDWAVDGIKANGLRLERQPKRPWSLFTTLMMYAGLSIAVQLKYLSNSIWTKDAVVDWDARKEVKKYLVKHDIAKEAT